MYSLCDPPLWIAASAIALTLGGCNEVGSEAAAASQLPASERPVGPVPGPRADAGPTVNPFGSDEAALRDGRLYFMEFNCVGCHGDHGGGGMGPSLRDADWLYGGSDAQIFSSITEGRGHGMPAWGVKLPSEVAWKLVSYIKSMRTTSEPSPPDETTPAPPEVPIP